MRKFLITLFMLLFQVLFSFQLKQGRWHVRCLGCLALSFALSINDDANMDLRDVTEKS